MRPKKSLIESGLSSPKPGIISSRCGLNYVLKKKRACLDDQNLEQFRASCFGRFFDVPTIQFRGNLAYLMMLHMCVEDRGSVWFKNQTVEFGPEEFYLCTGLRFGPDRILPRKSDIHSRIFGGRKTVYVKEIEDALTKASEKDKGSELTLKLALLYFLYPILFAQDHGRKFGVKLIYMHLVDDLALFNSYPWGRGSYNFLVDNMFLSYNKLCEHLDGNGKVAYDLHGFSHALMCWAYEFFPCLGSLCTSIVKGHESLVHRLLRRQSQSKKRFDELKMYFVHGEVPLLFEKMIHSVVEESRLVMERPFFPIVECEFSCPAEEAPIVSKEQTSGPDEGYFSSACPRPTDMHDMTNLVCEYLDFLREAMSTV